MALAGRRHCQPVANGRLRHMLIGNARVSKVDGSLPAKIAETLTAPAISVEGGEVSGH